MFIDRIAEKFNRKEAVINASLVMLMLHSSRYYFIKVPIGVLCIAALVMPAYKLAKPIWLGIFLLLVLLHIPYLYEMDNFTYIHIYLSLAIFICSFADDFEKALAFNARVMLVIIFGFAAINKLFSGDYMNGAFFHFSFLTDNRFTRFLTAIHLLPKEAAQYNWHEFIYMTKEASMPHDAILKSTPGIALASKILTYAAVLMEASIAIIFLLPRRFWITRYRDYFLFTFILVTYSFANVTGFGAVITILGLAQCDSKRKPLLYIGLFLLLELYGMGIYKAINKLYGLVF